MCTQNCVTFLDRNAVSGEGGGEHTKVNSAILKIIFISGVIPGSENILFIFK